jgi:hypothetical protein
MVNIVPLYRLGSLILVGLDIDFIDSTIEDGLVVEIYIGEKAIKVQPWSIQKMLKFGYYYPIPSTDRVKVMEEITFALNKNKIIEIIDILFYPSVQSVESLIWRPARLKDNTLR